MSRDRIYVTAFRRPEMLWWSLDYLSKCQGIDTVDVWVYVDWHANELPHPGIDSVISDYRHIGTGLHVESFYTAYGDMGPITFKGMRDALRDDVGLLMLVEEDVCVAPDFIQWSRAVHAKFQPFCAYGIIPGEIKPTGRPEDVGLGPWFCAWGASFGREAMKACIEHDVHEYHTGQHAYLSKHFPGWEQCGAAWDGLICRLLGQHGRKGAYPHRARAYNLGVYGHFRSRTPPWKSPTLEGHIAEVGELIRNPDAMQALAPDCRPCDLNIPPWHEEDLCLV